MDFPDQFLARIVTRVGLAGKNQQHRAFRIFQYPAETLGIGKQQGCTFVGRKPPRKTHRQDIRFTAGDVLRHALHQGLAAAIAAILVQGTLQHIFKQFGFQRLTQTPVAVVGDFVYALPVLFIQQFVAPGTAKTHVIQVGPVACQECLQMHTIGDITDGVFPVGHIRPDIVLHLRGNRPVNTAYPVMKA